MKDQAIRNQKLAKDLSVAEEITFITKIFNFFFFVLRKQPNTIFLTCLLITLETLQLISYAIDEPHLHTWKLSSKPKEYLQIIIGSTRITPLMKYINFNYYLILYGVICGYVFFLSLFLTMVIKFNKTSSKFYHFGVSFIRYFSTPMTTFLFIPMIELMLFPSKCIDNKVDFVKDPIECYKNLHFLYLILGIIFTVVYSLVCLLL